MNKWREIFEENKRLDDIFNTKYNYEHEIYEKNVIGFLVELGEFINETKCFKYWTIKKPDKDKILEEYADCIMSSMTFLDSLPTYQDLYKTNNILELLNCIYSDVTKLYDKKDVSLSERIFVNILELKKYLSLTDDELQDACIKKQQIVFERLNSDY